MPLSGWLVVVEVQQEELRDVLLDRPDDHPCVCSHLSAIALEQWQRRRKHSRPALDLESQDLENLRDGWDAVGKKAQPWALA